MSQGGRQRDGNQPNGRGAGANSAADPQLDRSPPFSLEAERSLLGSMMLLPEVCDEITPLVSAEDFYDEPHRKLFEHLMEMYNAGRKIDMTLLRDRLKDSGDYDAVGGGAYLADVFTSVPNAAHATYYAEIIREKSTLRRLIYTCTEVLNDAFNCESNSGEMLADAEQKVFAIRDQNQSGSISNLENVLHVALDRLDARMRGDHTEGTVDTGFHHLDQLTGGLHSSELAILAARPGMGKTAFAMNIAEFVAASGYPILFVSLEMSAIELVERLLCSVARVDSHRLRNGTLNQQDRKRLVERAGAVSKYPFFVDDSPTKKVADIAAAARRIKRRENGLGLLVIDYLQLIDPDNSRDPRQEQVAKIARRLKGLARELNVPVLCLSQLNRQAEDGREHRPKLSHLRESGAIEQDADIVMFVHREEYFTSGEAREQVAGQAQVIVAKQRNGPIDDIDLRWEKKFTRFENLSPERYSEFDEVPEPEFTV